MIGLASLTMLTWLSLADSNFSNTHILATLTLLRHLRLSSSAVSEVRAVAQLTNLEQLHMPFLEDVEDLSPLARLPALKVLDIGDTLITSLASLDVARIANIDRLCFLGAQLRYYDLFAFACHHDVVLELRSRHAGSWQNLWVRCSNTPVARASLCCLGHVLWTPSGLSCMAAYEHSNQLVNTGCYHQAAVGYNLLKSMTFGTWLCCGRFVVCKLAKFILFLHAMQVSA